MKTTTDKLFKLIKAMSPAEKRYFKRHYGSDSNKLTHLFDAINAQKNYDEEAIKEQFKTKMASNLKVYKFQLEQLVIKSLASHRDQSSTAFKVRSAFAAFEILFDKNLIEMASKQLDRIRQICQQENCSPYQELIFFAEWQNRQALFHGQEFNMLNLPHWSSKMGKVQDQFLLNLNQLNLLIDQIQSNGKTQQDNSAPLNLEMIQVDYPPNHILWQFYLGFQSFINGDSKTALLQLEEATIQLEDDPENRRQWGSYYLFALRLMAKFACKQGESAMLQKQINRALAFTKSEQAFGAQMGYFWAIETQEKIRLGKTILEETLETNWEYLCVSDGEDSFPASWYAAWVAHYGLLIGNPGIVSQWSQHLLLSESIQFRELGVLLKAMGQIHFKSQDIDLHKLFKGLKKTGSFYQSFKSLILEFSNKATPLNGQLNSWEESFPKFQKDPTFLLFETLDLLPLVHNLLNGEDLKKSKGATESILAK